MAIPSSSPTAAEIRLRMRGSERQFAAARDALLEHLTGPMIAALWWRIHLGGASHPPRLEWNGR